MYFVVLSLTNLWQVINLFVAVLVLIATICAAYAARQSKYATQRASQESLNYQLQAKYSSNEMHEALKIIEDLFDTRIQDKAAFLNEVKTYHSWCLTKKRLIQYEKTNQARRQISHFFKIVFERFSKKALDEDSFRDFCTYDSFKFLYYVIEWLELAFNPDYDRKTFTELLEQSGRDDIEDLKKKRPPPTWPEVEQIKQHKQQHDE